MSPAPLAGDGPADVEVGAPTRLGDGYRAYERYEARLSGTDGTVVSQTRDILRGGAVVGVLACDLAHGLVVLVRQFRLPAYLALGQGRSEMVEIIAGGIEPGEAAERAARRECLEETGLQPGRMSAFLHVMPTPGITDEKATLFLAEVDAGHLPERAGLAEEGEVIRPLALSFDAAIAMVESGRCANGYAVMALQWLALNRHRLDARLSGDTPLR